jgi:hypothetical protein
VGGKEAKYAEIGRGASVARLIAFEGAVGLSLGLIELGLLLGGLSHVLVLVVVVEQILDIAAAKTKVTSVRVWCVRHECRVVSCVVLCERHLSLPASLLSVVSVPLSRSLKSIISDSAAALLVASSSLSLLSLRHCDLTDASSSLSSDSLPLPVLSSSTTSSLGAPPR